MLLTSPLASFYLDAFPLLHFREVLHDGSYSWSSLPGIISLACLAEVPNHYVGMGVTTSHSVLGDITSVNDLDKIPTLTLIHI